MQNFLLILDLGTETVPEDDCLKGDVSTDDDDWDCSTKGDVMLGVSVTLLDYQCHWQSLFLTVHTLFHAGKSTFALKKSNKLLHLII